MMVCRYYNKPQATAEAFVVGENGVKYFRTGDLGKVDETGALRITGRLKEQYKLGNGAFLRLVATHSSNM